MQKAIFFAGSGTAYKIVEAEQKLLEVYPETIPALRFLTRRDFLLVLVTPEYQEYRKMLLSLKDKAITVYHWDIVKEELTGFVHANDINLEESYFITDGQYLKKLQNSGCKTILVLSGMGCCLLDKLADEELKSLSDVCKDIYAAAFSVAHKLL